MSELKRLQKEVVGTKDSFDAAYDAWDTATANDYASAYHMYNDAYDAWSRARLDLNNYLKE